MSPGPPENLLKTAPGAPDLSIPFRSMPAMTLQSIMHETPFKAAGPFVMRHGEAEHNVAKETSQPWACLEDPNLTG